METLKQVTIIEPASHSNIKTELLIPRGIYSSDVRLANVGVSDYTPSVGGVVVKYPVIGGVYQCIKNMYLYDDSELVNACYNVYKLAAFLNINHSSSDNFSKYSNLTKSSLNLVSMNNVLQLATPLVELGQNSLSVISLNDILPFFSAVNQESFEEIKRAMKDTDHSRKRKTIKKILMDNGVVRVDLMKKPRLVIEWNYNIPWSQLFVDATDADKINFQSPVLIMDRILDESNFDKNTVSKYFEYGHDIVNLPEVGVGRTQNFSIRLRGCENKFLHKLFLLMKSDSDVSSKQSGGFSQYKEQLNFKINNELFFSENVDTYAKKAYITDTSLGQVNMSYGGNNISCNSIDNVESGIISELIGCMDYFACSVDELVESLYLQYSRVGYKYDATQEEQEMTLFYLVDRTMSSNGSQAQYLQ